MSYGGGTKQGWGPDPFGQHQERWFSWGQATGLVRDGMRETFDPVPADGETPQAPPPRLTESPAASQPLAADGGWAPGADTQVMWPTASPPQVPVSDPWQAPAPETAKRSKLRWVAAAIALVVIGAMVTAVIASRHASPPSPAVLVGGASNRTMATQTAHFSSTTTVSGASSGTYQVLESGNENFATKSLQANLDIEGQSETVRVVGDDIYLQPPALVPLPNGIHWVEISPQDLGTSTSPSDLNVADPAQGLQFLGGAVGSPVVVGSATVGGVRTTHYRIVLNLRALFAKLGNAEGHLSPDLGRTLQTMSGDKQLTAVPGEVWLDSADRVRRIKFTLSLQIAGQTVDELSTTDFTNFGVSVVVDAPAPSDTVPISGVIGEIGGSSSHLVD
jgi:hypothetical protein